MKRLLGLVFALSLCCGAIAQVDREAASGFGMRLGIYWPTDSDVRDATDNIWNIGLEYTLEKPLFGDTGETFLAADFLVEDLDGWAFTVNHRMYTGMSPFSGEGNRMYWYLGGGLLMLDDVDDDSVFAARLGLGFELGAQAVGELGIFFADDVDGENASGIQASIGFRFP